MKKLWALWRLELLRLLRMGEVYRYLLLPTLVAVPAVVAVIVLYQAFVYTLPVVALPVDLPDDLPLAIELVDQNLQPRVVADPAQAWQEGVDAAVVACTTGEGMAGADEALELASPWRWRVDVLATDPEVRSAVGRAVRQAGNRVLEEEVVLAGGHPQQDLWFASASLQPIPADAPWMPGPRLWVAWTIFVLGTLAYQLLVVPSVADRRDGVVEAVLATACRPVVLLWARVLAVFSVQAVAVGLLLGGLYLFTWGLLGAVMAPPAPAVAGMAVAGMVLVDSLYLTAGMVASSLKSATNLGTAVMLLVMGLLAAGALEGLPWWVPLGGLAAAKSAFQMGGAALISVSTAVVLLALLGWGMRHFVALEPGGGRL